MYISLVECDQGNIAVEEDDFSKAIKIANSFIDNPECGTIYAAQIFETDKVIMGSENIKRDAKLVASLRTMR